MTSKTDSFKPNKRRSLKDHQQIDRIPSNYTHAYVATFHRTILAILSQKELAKLQISEIYTVLNFIYILTDLIDAPLILNERSEKNQKNSNTNASGNPVLRIKGLGVLSRSKKCLHELVAWMQGVVNIQNLTMEILLEEYYTKFPCALKPPVIVDTGSAVSNTVKKTNNKNSGKP
jgi:hypothetical protein